MPSGSVSPVALLVVLRCAAAAGEHIISQSKPPAHTGESGITTDDISNAARVEQLLKHIASCSEPACAETALAAERARLGSGVLVDCLSNVINTGDEALRSIAVWALGELGEAAELAIPALESLLKFGNLQAGGEAIACLRRIGWDSKPLVTEAIMFLKHGNTIEQSQAMGVLAAIGEDAAAAVPALIAVLDDLDRGSRYSAMDVLKRIGVRSDEVVARLTAMLESDDEFDRRFAIDALLVLGRGNEKASRALCKLLRANRNYFEAASAISTLGVGGQEAVSILIEDLHRPAALDRAEAAQAISYFGRLGAAAIPDLVGCLLRDTNQYARLCAGEALSSILSQKGRNMFVADDDPAHYQSMTRLARELALLDERLHSEDATVRRSAVRAFVERDIPARRAIECLIGAIADSDPTVQHQVLNAMTKMSLKDADRAMPLLERAMQQDDEVVRAGVVVVMGSLMDEDYLDAEMIVMKALTDPSEIVRRHANDCSLKSKQRRAEVQQSKLSPEMLQKFLGFLKSPDEDVKRLGFQALVRACPRTSQYVPALVDALNEASEPERCYIADLLRRIGPPARVAVPKLKELLKDESERVRMKASQALRRIGSPDRD